MVVAAGIGSTTTVAAIVCRTPGHRFEMIGKLVEAIY